MLPENKMRTLRVLNVEDSEDDSELLLRHLIRNGFNVQLKRVETVGDMKTALKSKEWDIIISDYQMPYFTGLGALEILKKSGLDIPFIVISGTIGEETAVKAMLAGVNDYLMKNNMVRLVPAIERELQEAANRKAHRQSERKLQESEKRLQLALSAAGMGVWEWNLQNNRIYWSPECYQITKTESFNNTLQGFLDLIHPEDAPKILALAEDAITNKNHYVADFRIINSQSEIQWLSNFGIAEYDQDGKPLRLIGTIQDITERKKAEVALLDSEEKFRALVQATSQYVWTSHPDLSQDEFPKWWSDLTGQTIEESQNFGWINVIHPEDRETAKAGWQKALEQKTPMSLIYRLLTKKGEYRYFALRGVPVYDNDGNLRRWVGALNDITERKQNEEELKRSEQRFRSLVSATAQIVWTADPKGVLLSAHTPYGESIDGASNNIGEEWYSRIHPDDKERVLATFSNAIQSKTNYRCEYKMSFSNDDYHYIIARGMPVFEKDGSVREWIGTLTDITESKLAEAELLKKEEQLRQAQKLESIGRLAGGIAHDFNNMLTVINGYSDLVIRSLKDDNPLRRKIEEIKIAGERAAELTNQLLTFSRRQLLKPELIDVNQIISDTGVMLQRLIGEDIQIIKELNPNLSKIKADSGQISQILMNLVINSRDAMPQGGNIVIKTDNVYLDEEFVNYNIGANIGDYVLLRISDNGVGMGEEIKTHIFEPFFTTKEVGYGTGLGLSTVYGIVSQSGGYISVDSKVGKGTTFDIYLPGIKESVSPLEKPIPRIEFTEGTETILLVEDEELVRKLSRQILESAGYKVIEASNGAEALLICEQIDNKIDLLITDVVMPEMSGRELADKLSEICPLVLFTSGYTDDAIVRHGVTNVNFNFLQKPFTFDELIQKVRGVLNNLS